MSRARTAGQDGTQDGTVVLVALGLLTVVTAVGIAAVDVGLLVAARSSAQTAADLAALGSLTPSTAPPRQVAAEIATVNGARLTSCTCQVDTTEVTVEREARLLPTGQVVRLRARARAELPATPLYPSGVPPARGSGTATDP